MIAPGIGTAIGAGVGLIGGGLASVFGAKKRDKMIADQNNAATQYQNQWLEMIKTQMDKNQLATWMPQGDMNFRPFGMYGTKLPKFAFGGKTPIAEDAVVVNGPDHEQGGVQITNPNGQPVAEVEGEEVIVEDKVFSKRLVHPSGMTFAEVAQKIATSPAYRKYKNEKKIAEQKSSSSDVLAVNTGERMLETLVNPLDGLFQLQTAIAPKEQPQVPSIPMDAQGMIDESGVSLPQGKYGVKLPKYIFGNPPVEERPEIFGTVNNMNRFNTNMLMGFGKRAIKNSTLGEEKSTMTDTLPMFDKINTVGSAVIPFIDNIINANLSNKTPQVIKPTIAPFIPLETKYNNNAELRGIREDVKAANIGIDTTNMSGGAASARKMATLAIGSKAYNKSMQDKLMTEQGLRNNNRLAFSKYVEGNTNMNNLYQNAVRDRNMALLGDTSTNIGNLQEDMYQMVQDSKGEMSDARMLRLLRSKYKDTGVFDRNTLDLYLQEALKQFKRSK
jgi:hypothetical protein